MPKKISHVSEADHDIVTSAVAAAEAHTSGEIVAGCKRAHLGGGQARQEQGGEEESPGHALAGSTSMRPFISMCIAWQNHEQ